MNWIINGINHLKLWVKICAIFMIIWPIVETIIQGKFTLSILFFVIVIVVILLYTIPKIVFFTKNKPLIMVAFTDKYKDVIVELKKRWQIEQINIFLLFFLMFLYVIIDIEVVQTVIGFMIWYSYFFLVFVNWIVEILTDVFKALYDEELL